MGVEILEHRAAAGEALLVVSGRRADAGDQGLDPVRLGAAELAILEVDVVHDLGDVELDPEAAGFQVVVSGHSHRPSVTGRAGVLYVNPGSVGISYDRHADPLVLRPLAEWALLTITDGTVAVEFRQVQYAVEDVRDAAKRSGRPYADEWAAQWPATPRP